MWPFTRKPKKKKPNYLITECKHANGNVYYVVELFDNWMEWNEYQMKVATILSNQEFNDIVKARKAITEAEIEASNLMYRKVVKEIFCE